MNTQPTLVSQPLDVAALQTRLRAFSDARAWEPYQTPKNLAMAMVAEAGELVEIFQWLTPEESTRIAERPAVQQHLGEELSDVLVYLLQIADRCGIDIAAAVDRKIGLNAIKYPPRPLKPGETGKLDAAAGGDTPTHGG